MNASGPVLVLGAHPEATRYANKAQRLLTEKGYEAVPINPRFPEILGQRCYASVDDWARESGRQADTVTLYLNPVHSSKLQEALLALKPRRVIFNPGAENAPLKAALEQTGVETVEGCTLVMLNLGSF